MNLQYFPHGVQKFSPIQTQMQFKIGTDSNILTILPTFRYMVWTGLKQPVWGEQATLALAPALALAASEVAGAGPQKTI